MPYNRELNGAMPHYLSSFEQAKTCSHIINLKLFPVIGCNRWQGWKWIET